MPINSLPLTGVRIADFTTLLPGPLATLLLAEAGACVIKIERPGTGDEMRSYSPQFGVSSSNFAVLNRGKLSVEFDLKDSGDTEAARELLREADIVIEQFRPGVMDRLGLGYSDIAAINPTVIYCSVTGYGNSGALAQTAGHDLNYAAAAGILSLSTGADGSPVLPQVLIGDIAAGAYGAVINIAFALLRRSSSGLGTHLQVSMTENLFPLQYWALSEGFSTGEWPKPNQGLVVGGSPRYALYQTLDNRHLAVAALEDRFWNRFCDLIAIGDTGELDDESIGERVAESVAARTAEEWEDALDGEDVCCNIVLTLEEAVSLAAVRVPGLFEHMVSTPDAVKRMPALPLPLDPSLRRAAHTTPYPGLGEHTFTVKTLGWPGDVL